MTGNFFLKSQIINMLVFVDQTICVTTQLYCYDPPRQP